MSEPTSFIPNSGGSIVSFRVLEKHALLRWAIREEPTNPVDNGWRFFSEIDDDSYLSEPNNLRVASFNTIAEIEPAIIPLYDLPVGADIELVREDDGKILFYDNITGKQIQFN